MAFTAYRYVKGSFSSSPLTQRCISNGTLDEDGTYAKCQISFTNSTIGGTAITTTARATIGSYSNTSTSSPMSVVIGGGALATGNSYSVTYTLTDAVGTAASASDILSVSFHTMNFASDGKGVGIGQAGVSGYCDINNMTLRINQKLLVDLIYPVGSVYMSATLDTAAKVNAALGGGT